MKPANEGWSSWTAKEAVARSIFPRSHLGIATEDAPAPDVVFDTAVTLTAGRFTATAADASGGARRGWARISLGTWCEMSSAHLPG